MLSLDGHGRQSNTPSGRRARTPLRCAAWPASVRAVALALFLIGAGAVAAGATTAAAAPLPPGWPVTRGLLAYDSLLARHVWQGGVDYEGLLPDRAGLDRFLDEAASIDSTALAARAPREQIAYWINVYNALTIDLVLRNLHGPGSAAPSLRSIQDVPQAWSAPRRTVAGARRSLDDIEHGILRARFREARLHAALVCASRSCPILPSRAYESDSLDSQLDRALRRFLADPTRNDATVRGGAIRLSRLFEWYGPDFARGHAPGPYASYGAREGGLLAFLEPYLPVETVALLRRGGVRIEFLPYDWSLNTAPARQ